MNEPDVTQDAWAEKIAAYGANCQVELTAELRAASLVRVADTIGTALGATGSDAAQVVERYAGDLGELSKHTVWGTAATADVEAVALANGVKARYLDFNDAYYGMSSCHPSDIIPTVFAAALEVGASDDAFLRGCALGFEVILRVSDRMEPRLRGFDHVNMTFLGALVGVAHVMELDEQQLRHALGVMVTSHAALRQTRTGQLSMWKAFAAADACRHALYSARLGAAGVEGPPAPFAGQNAYFRRAMGWNEDEFPELALAVDQQPWGIANTQIKKFPAGSVGQSAAQAGEDLVAKGLRLDDVVSIDIRLDPKAYPLMVSPEKLQPRTRETADHSIPYLIVSALERGRIDVSSFEMSSILSEPTQRFLADNITVSETEELAGGHERGFPIALTATTTDGRAVDLLVESIPGTPGNEMSDEELKEKFHRNLTRSLLEDRTDEIWQAAWAIGGDTGDGIAEVNRLLRA